MRANLEIAEVRQYPYTEKVHK